MELAVLEHSKHCIKAFDKMQAATAGSFVAIVQCRATPLIHGPLSASGYPLCSTIERGRHDRFANGSHQGGRRDDVPVTIALTLVFAVLSHFWACNPGKPWWRRREFITDLCCWFFVPVSCGLMA
ncbi:hypothetical protein CQ13_00470 [Bradyrhizobium retamae]|uniref:Uncharacterized protein n=1 Tax=Bradyrhizobium retamae TaxID=1300035 RepID=A0A0R3NCY3_9BRAD|nr:hypothetical protein CQ13_00470 [Bradyrhizobium retamae]